jgi:hypothetical protein
MSIIQVLVFRVNRTRREYIVQFCTSKTICCRLIVVVSDPSGRAV